MSVLAVEALAVEAPATRSLRLAPDLPSTPGVALAPMVRPVPALDPPLDSDLGPALLLLPGGAQTLPFATPTTCAPIGWVDDDFGPQPTRSSDLPAPRPWATRFLQATTEVLAGHRSPAQLVPMVSETVHREITSASRVRRTPQVRVSSVRVDEPADGVAEVSAVVRWRDRAGAMAARLEGIDGRWRCTSLRWI